MLEVIKAKVFPHLEARDPRKTWNTEFKGQTKHVNVSELKKNTFLKKKTSEYHTYYFNVLYLPNCSHFK
jgi:hypothetical protein